MQKLREGDDLRFVGLKRTLMVEARMTTSLRIFWGSLMTIPDKE
jgi:hypothetical protein